MNRIYDAILIGDRLEWKHGAPQLSGPVDVQVQLTGGEEQIDHAERRRRVADALESIAVEGGITSIPDPVAWQREVRTDKPLSRAQRGGESGAGALLRLRADAPAGVRWIPELKLVDPFGSH